MLKPTLAASLLFTALIAGQTANAADGQYLDNKGDRIDTRYEARADRADSAGHEQLANRLDAKGNRIDARLDHRGEVASNRLDRIDDRFDRRWDRRH